MRRRREKSWALKPTMIAAGLVIGAAVPWSAGLVRFASAIPDTVADPVSHTDAIVVLTGGSERVATGLQLLAENKAERMFVSGVHPAVDVAKLIRLAGRPLTDFDRRVEAGHGALDTGGNAAETAAWMRQRGYRSLRLVTGNYHMPRSLFEFRIALPAVEVIPHPVFPYNVQRRTWWLRPGTAALIIGEYNKYLLASLEHWAGYRLFAERSPRGIG
jgi:uncharacterized SAM-binding protein YcdF (DUF218 family)